MNRMVALLIGGLIWLSAALADEAPISGTVKSIEPTAQTVTLETTVTGKTREVTVAIKPASHMVWCTRSAEPGKSGLVEQAAALGDLKPS